MSLKSSVAAYSLHFDYSKKNCILTIFICRLDASSDPHLPLHRGLHKPDDLHARESSRVLLPLPHGVWSRVLRHFWKGDGIQKISAGVKKLHILQNGFTIFFQYFNCLSNKLEIILKYHRPSCETVLWW